MEPKLESADVEEDDGSMNEFLSRFVWIMRGKISETFPDYDKKTVDAMLLMIVEKVVSEMEKGSFEQSLKASTENRDWDLSEDLWKTVSEVSNMVLDDMKKATKKEKMKGFLLSEEVQEMCRFAGEVGIRGDMLREFRFKWAREKMEESEFYESLEQLKKEACTQEENNDSPSSVEAASEVKSEAVSLPKRRGKIKYKIYGLDLSDPKWSEVADKVHEAEEVLWPQEPKPISGKCKLVTERILSLNDNEDPSPLLAEWKDLLQPTRVDWIALLDKLNESNRFLYLKVAELLLSEESFQTDIRDYSKLVDVHAKENRLEDAERILKKMNEKGITPDILTASVLVHMYSKVGNLDRAKEAFDTLRSHGFQPDEKVYNSMIMAFVNAGQPKLGESLMREMEARDIKPSQDIYMALLRSFSQRGDISGAGRISATMQFAGFSPSLESCTLLIEAYGQAGDPDQARNNFDYMIKIGHRPDDRCTASMVAAYEKKNLLDKALNLLLQLEKDGFEPGVATYAVLVDWLGKLQLVDEAEQMLGKIGAQGDALPFKVHISLCDMYSRAGIEKKALQALGVLEAKKEELGHGDFERIINGLIAGGFVQDAKRLQDVMEAQGFTASQSLQMALRTSQALRGRRLP
ncbi:Pentatricopeptide repeat-containing protein, partial [Cucurbita argyrosperma subsp. sororia]